MQQRIELLNGCFEWLEKAALKQLKEKQISIEDLCLKVTSLKCLWNDNSINFFVVNQMECLFKSSSVVIVFGFLNTYWSYLSYHLLEHVINQCSLVATFTTSNRRPCRSQMVSFFSFSEISGDSLKECACLKILPREKVEPQIFSTCCYVSHVS